MCSVDNTPRRNTANALYKSQNITKDTDNKFTHKGNRNEAMAGPHTRAHPRTHRAQKPLESVLSAGAVSP